jgi:anti-sigma regulatory factor (Ser/Thr protein kinase)
MYSQPIHDQSHIAEARRGAVDAATTFGFDETQAGRVAIVATELATNVLRHGGRGEMLIGNYDDESGAGIELIALDQGRGIADLQAALRDGFSSAGSSGHGLGAIRRQSQTMEIASWPDMGTAVLARIDQHGRPAHSMPKTGSVSIPMPGETVCGDSCAVAETEFGRTLLVADGLGHGPDAAMAASEAVRLFRRHQARPVPEILEYLHNGLRATRGAAVSVARADVGAGKVIYSGIGNIAAAIIAGSEVRRMVSLNGTAGHNARKIQAFDYPLRDGLIIMVSDGLSSSWSVARYPGVGTMHPTLIAALLYRDFSRRRDDATVLVSRGVSA